MALTGYQKRYRLRRAVPTADSIITTYPFEVVDRKARELGITVDELLTTYSVIAEYDDDIVRYTLCITPVE